MKYYDLVNYHNGEIDCDVVDKEIDMCVNFGFNIHDVDKYKDAEESSYFWFWTT